MCDPSIAGLRAMHYYIGNTGLRIESLEYAAERQAFTEYGRTAVLEFIFLCYISLSHTCSVPIGTGAPFHIHSDAINVVLKGRKRCIANCMLLKLCYEFIQPVLTPGYKVVGSPPPGLRHFQKCIFQIG